MGEEESWHEEYGDWSLIEGPAELHPFELPLDSEAQLDTDPDYPHSHLPHINIGVKSIPVLVVLEPSIHEYLAENNITYRLRRRIWSRPVTIVVYNHHSGESRAVKNEQKGSYWIEFDNIEDFLRAKLAL